MLRIGCAVNIFNNFEPFMYRRFLIISFLILSPLLLLKAQILPSFGDSRTGTTGFQFLKIGPDARSAGMAESYISTVDDVSALFWNPAGIAGVDTFDWHFSGGHNQYFSNITLQHIGVVRALGSDTYLGLGMVYLNSGDMPVTTEFMPQGTGQTFRTTDMALGLTLARKLTDQFQFGITSKYIYEGIAGINTHGLVFDFGFQYDVGLANTHFAVGVSNFGFNTTPRGSIDKVTLAGNTLVSDFESISIPSVFRLGFSWDPVLNERNRWTLALQLNHPTDNNETLGIGTEYFWNHLLYLRAGYLLGMDESGLPSFGFGIDLKRNFGRLRFDYGYLHKTRLGMSHRFTMGISLR